MYTRFAILTTPRSGSTYLTHMLGTHPQVLTYSEVLNEEDIGWGRWKSTFQKKNNTWLRILRNLSPNLFLKWCIYRSYEPTIRAVGFKLMYSQITHFPGVLNYLKNNQIKIIHLKRSNLLKMYISLRRGELSNVWHTTNNKQMQNIKLYLSPKECKDYFKKIETQQKHFERLLLGNPMITVSYENLRMHKDEEIAKIENFLRIHPERLTSIFQKMNKLPLSESIINYQELKKIFKNTRWKKFFR